MVTSRRFYPIASSRRGHGPHKGKKQEMPNQPDTLNAREAADFLKAHVETIRRLARKGEIPSFKVGKDWRFFKNELVKWAQSNPNFRPSAAILIIDDEPAIRSYLKKLLKSKGFVVFEAENGDAGLQCLKKETVNLILLDLEMPEMNGAEFLAKLRQKRIKIPVILITGYPDSDHMSDAMRYSPLMLVSKPIGKQLLFDAIETIVNSPG